MINRTLVDTTFIPNPTGIIVVVFGAQNQIAGGIIERAPVSSSGTGSGTYTPIGTLNTIDPSGTPYIDPLPMDGTVYYYRAKHARRGFQDSAYTTEISGSADVIPANINWDSKPWLFDGSVTLQLVMKPILETPTVLTVSSSVNRDPAGLGTPVISVLDYFGITAPTPSGSGIWTIDKPLTGSARVIFESTMAGRHSGLDALDVQSIATTSTGSLIGTGSFLALVLTTMSSSAASVTVSGSVINPLSYPYSIGVTGYNGVIPVAAGTNVWTIARPVTGVGSVTFAVSSSTAGVIPDYDTYYVDSQYRSALSVIGTITAANATGVTSSFAVRDPLQPSGSLTGITLIITSGSQTGFSSSYAASTNTGGVFTQPIYSSRPLYGAGAAQIVATATKDGYTLDSDSVTIPEQYIVTSSATFTSASFLSLIMTQMSSSATSVTYSGSVINLAGGTTSIAVSAYTPNLAAPNLDSTNVWTITRPASGVGTVTWHVSSSVANIVDDYAFEVINSQNLSALIVTGKIVNPTPTILTGSFQIRDPFQSTGTLTGITLTLTSQSDAFSASLGTPVNTSGLQTIPFYSTYPIFGQGRQQLTGIASKAGYTDDGDSISVPEVGYYPLVLTVTLVSSSATQYKLHASASDATGGSYPSMSLSNPSGLTNSRVTINSGSVTSPSSSFNNEEWLFTRSTGSDASVTFTTTKTGRVTAISSYTIPAQAGAVDYGSTPTITSFTAERNSTVVDLTWSVVNPPASVTYDVSCLTELSDNTTRSDISSGITSPNGFNPYYSIVNKGDAGWMWMTLTFTMRMLNSSDVVVATKQAIWAGYTDKSV